VHEVGRSDPCPCGSGRTSEACCFDDERGSPEPAALPRDDPDVDAGAWIWMADVVPIGPAFQVDPSTRPALLVVRAGSRIIVEDVMDRPPAEPGELARLIERAIVEAIETEGRTPTFVGIHEEDVATALAPLLRDHGVTVKRVYQGELREFVRFMICARTGEMDPLASRPDTWTGWGLPDATVADLFRATAELWRAAPWRWIASHRILTVELADGRAWTPALHGHAGDDHGLGLYSESEDYRETFGFPTVDDGLMLPHGRTLRLEYHDLHTLPRPMQREVASAGWEVAAPEAYPVLSAINTPGGGLTRSDAADLITVVRALAALPAGEAERIGRREPLRWRDPSTEAVVVYEGTDPAPRSSMGIWRLAETLQPGGPRGPGADPDAPVRARVAQIAKVRRTAQVAGILRRVSDVTGEAAADLEDELATRFSPKLERSAVDNDVPDRFAAALRADGFTAKEVDRHYLDVRAFLEVLEVWRRIPLAAVHDYDIRVFLFDLYPQKYDDILHPHEDITLTLEAFFRWLAEAEGIECRWEEALGDWVAYDLRIASAPPGPPQDDAVRKWRAKLRDDLDARVLLHHATLQRTLAWSPEADIDRAFRSIESLLEQELQRRWLIWRDELIRSGETDPEAVRALLVERQRAWEVTPHPALDGRTPFKAIEAERGAAATDE